jgi:hypothetical protein
VRYNPTIKQGGSVLTVLLIVAALAIALVVWRSPFDVKVTSWRVGSPDVAGTIQNNQTGCSDPEITLNLRDHNDAIVRQFTFGAGELAAGAHRGWTTHMVGLLMIDDPVSSEVTTITASVECVDKH